MGVRKVPAQVVNAMIGTAGHVHHGKSALVEILTGCAMNRLPEEKERLLTINLGFAPCTLPGGRGKTPVMPNYRVKINANGKARFRSWQGFIVDYDDEKRDAQGIKVNHGSVY